MWHFFYYSQNYGSCTSISLFKAPKKKIDVTLTNHLFACLKNIKDESL
jgi:hypothetical protein